MAIQLCYGIVYIKTSILCDSRRMQLISKLLVVVTLAVATLTNKVDVSSSAPTVLSNLERRTFLREHNRWRSLVRPPARDMLKMVWSTVLFIVQWYGEIDCICG